MVYKNDFSGIDLTRSAEQGSEVEKFDENSFLESFERTESHGDRFSDKLRAEYDRENRELYDEHEYSLEEYMKFDPSVELAGIQEHEERQLAADRAMNVMESNEPVSSEEDEALADAPWNDETPSDEEFEDMYHEHIMKQAEDYGLLNASEVDFEKLETAVNHLDDLYHNGKISKPVKVRGSLIVDDKGEVVVSGVDTSTDWINTTGMASDAVKNRNYDLSLDEV